MTEKKLTADRLILFSDFDGTISTKDVGNRLFHHFSDGKSDEPVARWLAGEIGSRQCLLEEAAAMRQVTEKELLAFIDSFKIDPSFSRFVDFSRDNDLPLYILSDGLDIYINRLLKNNGFDGLPFFANRAKLNGGRLSFTWPYYDESCGHCANCKGYHIRRLREPRYKAVYIGDGKSDLCALPEADLIFAKGFLAEYCRQSGIGCYLFDDFAGITETLKDLLAK